MLTLWILISCSSEPVLVGLAEDHAAEGTADAGPQRYEKSEAVMVDLAYLAGRGWNEVRGEAELQMGRIEGRVDRGRDGTEIQLAKGLVRVVDEYN